MGRLMVLALFLTVTGLAGFARADGTGSGGYRILRKAGLEGDGGSDFIVLDNAARRLYVTHADRLQVLDADSLKLIGTIEDVPHPHGVVVLPELGKGYLTSGVPGSVVVFDLKTLKKTGEIHSRPDTDVILYDHDDSSGKIFTFNGDSHDCTVIDPKTDKVVKYLKLGGDPEYAVSDGEGHIFDNLESNSEVIRIDTKTLKIDRRWRLRGGAETPSGLAMDRTHHRLFIGCRNKKMAVMDSLNGKVIATFAIGAHVDNTVFDPDSGNAFNSCGDGSLTIIHEDSPDKFHVVERLKTEPGAKNMAFDPKTGDIFTDAAKEKPSKGKHHHEFVPGSFEVLEIGK
jgi:DNA-binding beta-propeller fold protein YncE